MDRISDGLRLLQRLTSQPKGMRLRTMLSVLSVCRVFPQDRLAGAHELNALKPCSLDQPTGCIHPRDGSLEDSLKSFFSFVQSLSPPLIPSGGEKQTSGQNPEMKSGEQDSLKSCHKIWMGLSQGFRRVGKDWEE